MAPRINCVLLYETREARGTARALCANVKPAHWTFKGHEATTKFVIAAACQGCWKVPECSGANLSSTRKRERARKRHAFESYETREPWLSHRQKTTWVMSCLFDAATCSRNRRICISYCTRVLLIQVGSLFRSPKMLSIQLVYTIIRWEAGFQPNEELINLLRVWHFSAIHYWKKARFMAPNIRIWRFWKSIISLMGDLQKPLTTVEEWIKIASANQAYIRGEANHR